MAVNAGGGGFSRCIGMDFFGFSEKGRHDLTGRHPECEEQDYVMLI